MAERKTQNKYIPSDYDPRLLHSLKKKSNNNTSKQQQKLDVVHIMLPFNVSCGKCGAYMYRGRKFNAKKEVDENETYLGVKIIKFHFKCDTCSSTIVYRTDPETRGFKIVTGARENLTTEGKFTADLKDVTSSSTSTKEEESKGTTNAIEELEARALESKKEMETLQELERVMSVTRNRDLMSSSRNTVADPNEEEIEEDALKKFRETQQQEQLKKNLSIKNNESSKKEIPSDSMDTLKRQSNDFSLLNQIKVVKRVKQDETKEDPKPVSDEKDLESKPTEKKPDSSATLSCFMALYDDDDEEEDET